MIVAGCDVGSLTGKAVIMNGQKVVVQKIIRCLIKPEETAKNVLDSAVKEGGLESLDKIDYIIGTGYGRVKIPFADDNISEITCHMKGAYWLLPSVRTIIDIGGQDCKVIGVTEKGKVKDFVMNDKCAAGTGKFLEVTANTLNLSLDEFARLAMKPADPAPITSQCSVFAESEIISLLNSGRNLVEVIVGIHEAMAHRVSILAKRVGLVDDIAVTGGCAKNEGLIRALERKLRKRIIKLKEDPQIIGALGAALLANERVNKK